MIVKYVVIGLLAVSAIGSPIYFSQRQAPVVASKDDYRPPGKKYTCREMKQMKFETEQNLRAIGQDTQFLRQQGIRPTGNGRAEEYRLDLIDLEQALIDC